MRSRTKAMAIFAIAALVCAAPVAAHAVDEPPLEEEVAIEVVDETANEELVEDEILPTEEEVVEDSVIDEDVLQEDVVDEQVSTSDDSVEDVQQLDTTENSTDEDISTEDADDQSGFEDEESQEGVEDDNPDRYGIALSVDTEDATCSLPTRAYTAEDDPWQRDGVVTYTLDDVVVFSQPFYGGEFDFDLSYLIPQYRDGVARYIHVGATTAEDGLESSYYGPGPVCYALAEFGTWFNPYTGVVGLHIEGDVYFEDSEGNIYTESTELPLTQETTFTPYPTIEGQALDPVYGGPWTYTPLEVPDPTVVTPLPPIQDGNTVTIPDQDGVEYQDEDGNVLPPGDIVLVEDLPVVAVPEDGYAFPDDADTEWVFEYTPDEQEPTPTIVTPLPPTQDGNVVTIPDIEGVEYQDEDGTILPPGDITLEDDLTVIAVPEDGYEFEDGSEDEWTFVYTPPVGPPPPVIDPPDNGGDDDGNLVPGTGGDDPDGSDDSGDGNESGGGNTGGTDDTTRVPRGDDTLAATGAGDVGGLTAFALLALVAGAGLVRLGTRRRA